MTFQDGDDVVFRLRGALHRHKEVAYLPVDPVGNHHLDIARRLAVHRFHDPPMGYIPFIGDERIEAQGETPTKLASTLSSLDDGVCYHRNRNWTVAGQDQRYASTCSAVSAKYRPSRDVMIDPSWTTRGDF